MDPTFDVAQFLRIVQYDIIPNIFEVGGEVGFEMIIEISGFLVLSKR